MTPSKYDNLLIAPCPNCQSTDIEDSGNDCDGMVNCNYCGLMTPICYGTKSAIKVWNERRIMEK
jgi:hypothetical protein